MKKKTIRVFKFSLNPRNNKDAECIKQLDDLLEMIRSGSARRGDFSAEVGTALYNHFSGPSVTPIISNTPVVLVREYKTNTAVQNASTDAVLPEQQEEREEKEEDIMEKLKILALSFQ